MVHCKTESHGSNLTAKVVPESFFKKIRWQFASYQQNSGQTLHSLSDGLDFPNTAFRRS
jgi:hypothetical protein